MQHLLIWLFRVSVSDEYRIGVIGDLTVGRLGAIIGGYVTRELQIIEPENLLGHGATALVGAVVPLIAIRSLANE